MREIKFRAWDTERRKMGFPGNVIGMNFLLDYDGNVNLHGTNLELMQFTGLKDKNGKEIYEGDIVKGMEYNDSIEAVELFPEGSFEYDIAEWGHSGEDLEVIGNIYENKDLLE